MFGLNIAVSKLWLGGGGDNPLPLWSWVRYPGVFVLVFFFNILDFLAFSLILTFDYMVLLLN